jgi:UDP-N-acetylglucosamine 4,6-dehydratase
MSTVLIIGGTGSLGNSLVSHYVAENVVVFSRDENKQWSMKMKYPQLTTVVGDMRNRESIENCINRYTPHTVIIAGALKHVDICEANPNECIDTNINGVRNVISASINARTSPETVLLVSTDKACSPVNVYGMSKSIAERLMVDASLQGVKVRGRGDENKHIRFLCVRYGNVLLSRGSIIPKFMEIATDPTQTGFPITSENMTRFFMPLSDSVKLITTAIENGDNGTTWVPNVDSYLISDLAELFSHHYNKPVVKVGIRPGEKIHETLINTTEISKTREICIDGKDYYVIYPKAFETQTVNLISDYSSNYVGDREKLRKFLALHGVELQIKRRGWITGDSDIVFSTPEKALSIARKVRRPILCRVETSETSDCVTKTKNVLETYTFPDYGGLFKDCTIKVFNETFEYDENGSLARLTAYSGDKKCIEEVYVKGERVCVRRWNGDIMVDELIENSEKSTLTEWEWDPPHRLTKTKTVNNLSDGRVTCTTVTHIYDDVKRIHTVETNKDGTITVEQAPSRWIKLK